MVLFCLNLSKRDEWAVVGNDSLSCVILLPNVERFRPGEGRQLRANPRGNDFNPREEAISIEMKTHMMVHT